MKTLNAKHGFTLLELLVSILISVIVGLGIATAMASTQRTYQNAYNKSFTNIRMDSFVVQRLFEVTVRKSTASGITIQAGQDDVAFLYYNDLDSTYADRYTRFYIDDSTFMAEYGTVDPDGAKTQTETKTICGNVSACTFKKYGSCVSMIVTLADGQNSNTVVTSAYPHN